MKDVPRLCRICQVRRPKRYCPGVTADICSICCGTEREITVNCPLDCPFLREARKHEGLPQIDPRQFPNSDIRVDESFLKRNEALLILIASSIAHKALASGDIYDRDVKDALEALVRTYRTLQSGLVFESRPDNPLAARLYEAVQETVAEIRQRLTEHGQSIRDADILGVVAFLQRLEIQHNNGKPKGRAFLDFLRGFFPPEKKVVETPSQPSGGLIITP